MAQAGGALESAGAAKAEFEAQVNKSARLLFAAAEGMGNAGVRPGFAQVAQHGIHSVARVEDDGQPVPARQLELLAEKRLLPLAPGRRGQRGREKIQPDFAHGHQPRIARMRLQGGGQLLRRAFARLRHVERMGAQRVSVAQPVRGLPGLIKRAGAHSGNHAAAHTQRAGLLTHGGQVGGELGRVQMAVGVNPARHGGRGKAASNSGGTSNARGLKARILAAAAIRKQGGERPWLLRCEPNRLQSSGAS